MPRADLHTHTKLSHGTGSIAEMYQASMRAGLEYIGFSEHAPLPAGFPSPVYNTDLTQTFAPYAQEVLDLKRAWHEGLPRPLLGIELDWLPSCRPWMRSLIESQPFDYVYGSVHHLDGMGLGKAESWNISLEEQFARFTAYYCEMAALARSGFAQIVSHPDFIKLRVADNFHAWLELESSRKTIWRAMAALRENGLALEVNSAGLRQNFREFYPAPPVMEIAHALALPIVLGSDAHCPGDVANGLSAAQTYAASFGYNQSLIFCEKKPVPLPFEQ